MGSGGSSMEKERYERAGKTGMLTLSGMDISSWGSLVKKIKKVQGVRTLTLSDNALRRAMPTDFLRLPLWASLVSLDLSGNGLRCACVLGLGGRHLTGCGGGGAGEGGKDAAAPLSSGPPLRLEVLDISKNALEQLPPGLCRRFPSLRRLLCRGNTKPLAVRGGLLRAVGGSAALQSVDLSDCGLRGFTVVEEATGDHGAAAAPFPALAEIILDGNSISGTFSLVAPTTPPPRSRLPALKRVSLAHPKAAGALQAVDPTVYVTAPAIVSVDLKGHEGEAAIKEKLGDAAPYREWQERQADVLNKKLHNGGEAALM